MEYRRLGRSGLKVSELSFGSWVTYGNQLDAVARELGCSLAQLALAWCARNPRVSTVITGASRVSQVQENMKAVAVIPKLTPQVLERIDAATAGLAD